MMTADASEQGENLRIAMTGGGSGGHITPILAVAYQIKRQQPASQVIYIGQTGDGLGDIPAQDPSIDKTYSVRAGKLRRYHGEGWRQLLDIPTMLKNVRDISYVLAGTIQSYFLLRRIRPDVLFVKGGFVGVPVGLAAAALRIPFVTHDSDAMPGLANRLIARWARLHTVALPKEVYNYPPAKTVTVGVPISHEFRLRSSVELQAIRHELGITHSAKVILVTGGGLGAQRLNQAMVAVAPNLLAVWPDLVIVHIAGRQLEAELCMQYQRQLAQDLQARVTVVGFITNLYAYAAVADVVVTRAGGNSMAEFAAQAKACIVVPNPILSGGHQTKNGQVLADKHAVVLVSEAEIKQRPDALQKPIEQLLDNPRQAADIGARLHAIARPDAAHELAVVLLDVAAQTNNHNHVIQTQQSD